MLLRIALFTMLLCPCSQAVVLSQLETFDTAATWTSGAVNPSPPAIVADFGPMGGGDFALLVSSGTGSMEGSRLVTYDESSWTGDYLNAGVHTLRMDLRNNSLTSTTIRVAVLGPGGWWATPGVALPSFVWTRADYLLTPDDLLPVNAGSTDAQATLGDVTQIRILHSTSANFRADPGQRSLLIDNIEAVPEPDLPVFLALGGLVWCCRRKVRIAEVY